jgi:pimeloyl-ACP methyl ester carboxylesterase
MPAVRRRIGSSVWVDTPGFSGPVHVREDGPADGPVLVLIHGFSGSMHWYDLVVPLLADPFRLIRVDLLGHGSTRGPAVDAPAQAQMFRVVLVERRDRMARRPLDAQVRDANKPAG